MAVLSKLRLMSLPLDIHHEIEYHLDMLSLLALGATCLHFRDRVSRTLKRERNAIIRQYWANPESFLRLLSWSRAVITGEAALAFIMRDRSLLGDELEVCVSSGFSDDLLGDFERDPQVQHAWRDDVWPRLDRERPTAFLYKSPSGDLIRIICSHTDSPFTPLSTYPTTALFNYMDEFSFGSAYRDLTLNRRAVVPHLGTLTPEEAARVVRITNQGDFHQSQWPAAVAMPPVPFVLHNVFGEWPDADLEELVNTVCLRPMYQCTGQPRFFGDPGSLVDFFEPDMVDHAVMAHCKYPPYGPTSVWRMDGPGCDYNCAEGDYFLPDPVAAVCVIGKELDYGPFTTGVIGRVAVGESQHRRVWNSSPDNIKLDVRGVLWNTHA